MTILGALQMILPGDLIEEEERTTECLAASRQRVKDATERVKATMRAAMRRRAAQSQQHGYPRLVPPS